MSKNLSNLVRNCLAKGMNKSVDKIRILENKEKYYDINAPVHVNAYTNKIFSLMLSLNKEGMSNDSLGVINQGNSFKDALTKMVDNLSVLLKGNPFSYVELGPEPIKTTYIIERLLRNGCSLRSYTSVDINPSSSIVMRQCLLPFLSEDMIFSLNQDYHLCDSSCFFCDGIPKVFTMFGFQEGNEEPEKIAGIFNKMTEKEDIILSEMQMMAPFDMSPIYDFYNNEKMKTFSKIVFKQRFGNFNSVYGFFLLPMKVNGIHCFVAISTETILSEGEYFDQTVITNYCLKYHMDSFHEIREMNGAFHVMDYQFTENKSIVFQTAKRVA